jgi:hypothetical protein
MAEWEVVVCLEERSGEWDRRVAFVGTVMTCRVGEAEGRHLEDMDEEMEESVEG